MFEIYTKSVTIKTATGPQTFSIRPLSGRHLPKLYPVMKKFMGQEEAITEEQKKDQAEKFLNELDEKTVSDLHFLCLESLKKSYPTESIELMDEFVSQNLLQLMPAVIEVNINSKA